MRFWDASAVVPLVLTESRSSAALDAIRHDPGITAWWGTSIECHSAIARAEREQRIDASTGRDAYAALGFLRSGWVEMDATTRLRSLAERLVRVHPLRAADALQLAAATVAAEDRPASLPFVTLDDRLALAAEREGFPIIRFDRP